MFEVPASVANHVAQALEDEVARLKAIYSECGDDWPPDFDPNDIWFFEDMIPHFRSSGASVIVDPRSVTHSACVRLLWRYVRDRRADLNDADVNALFRIFARVMAFNVAPYVPAGTVQNSVNLVISFAEAGG